MKRPSRGRPRAVLLAGAVLAASAFGALDAGSASALGEQCSGKNILGAGAFLQEAAQTRWRSGKSWGFNGSTSPFACSGSQGAGKTPQLTGYTPIGSAAALHAWGADDGILHWEGRQLIGTDIAPAGPVEEAGSELANVKKAIGSDVVVVPVAQTAIAIVAHPPALPAHSPCAVPGVSAEQLEEVFSGQITNWRQLSTASDAEPGGDCDQAITRVVREESAGTTYQFKHFLDAVNSSELACSGKAKRTWTQLQAAFGEGPPNLEWPRKSDCQEGEGPVTTVTGKVGEGEVGPLAFVNESPGTITYASLPEAELHASKQIIDVYNGVQFADPVTKESEANCAAAEYTLPGSWAEGIDVDWSQVYGSKPGIGEVSETAYPICTLTWDLTAADAIHAFGKGAATTVHDYLDFVRSEAGQASALPVGYQTLPGPVAEAAAVAVGQIGGEEGEEEEEGGGPVVLCRVEPEAAEGVLVCPPGEGFSSKVTAGLMPETKATFESTGGPSGTVFCEAGELLGEFEEDGTASPEGGISMFEFGLGETLCSSSLEAAEGLGVLVRFDNPPYDTSKFVYLGALAPQGALVVAKGKGTPIQLRLEAAKAGFKCFYEPSFLSSQIVNGSPTELVVQGNWTYTTGGGPEVCPSSLHQSANLALTRTGEKLPLYISGK